MFQWEKKGLVFNPDGVSYKWMNSYAQVPFSIMLEDRLRVYFSTREAIASDGNFKSYSGYVDLDPTDFSNVLEISERPIIDLGGLGEFDEFGSMAGSVVKHNEEFFLYYCGWTRAVSTPYNWAIGLAKSKDGKRFEKIGPGPILGSTVNEPYLQACPIVFIENNKWHMFYLSGTRWLEHKGKKESQYLLMHATSEDGIDWYRNGVPVVPTKVENECQTSSSIIKIENTYHMLFSYRFGTSFRDDSNRGYRIGYARSKDLIHWERNDELCGLDVSDYGWDSEMIAYPHMLYIDGKLKVMYCGNYFGKSGFGYADHKGDLKFV